MKGSRFCANRYIVVAPRKQDQIQKKISNPTATVNKKRLKVADIEFEETDKNDRHDTTLNAPNTIWSDD